MTGYEIFSAKGGMVDMKALEERAAEMEGEDGGDVVEGYGGDGDGDDEEYDLEAFGGDDDENEDLDDLDFGDDHDGDVDI